MLDCQSFLDSLEQQGITFSTGVPDSLLKDICACISDSGKDIIAANEGGAIALATGYHLATGGIPFVYMQNSGFGNTINPLTSLVDPEVYSIPMLIMIGWRGEPGVKDEPQHVKQGRVNEQLLNALEIPYFILEKELGDAQYQLRQAIEYIQDKSAPFVFLVRTDTFEPYKSKSTGVGITYEMNREGAIEQILELIDTEATIVSTTGKTSREVFEKRAKDGNGHDRDFLTVGCMGHASQIALGIAISKPENQVFCLDGDGAFIMHMGSTAITADLKPANFKHIVINNGSHDSVGGQPTVAFSMDLGKIVEGCGYTKAFKVETRDELVQIWPEFIATPGPVFLEVRAAKGARSNLGRPTKSPIENKLDFMTRLRNL